MDIRKLQRVIVDGLEDVKAQNIAVYNTEHLSALFERVIIASGTSNRQTKSLASSVREAVKEAGFPVPRTEGEGNGEWIIVDCGAAVVHVMQPSIREYYHLEEIWGDKPVKMKMDGNAAKLVKAEEPDEPVKKSRAVAKKVAAKSAPAKKVAAKKAVGKLSPAQEAAVAPVRKSPAAKKTAIASKTAAKTAVKTAAKRVVAKKAAVTRTTGVKTPIKMIVVNSPSLAKKADARKAAARGVVVKRPAAKKAPARKTSSRA
ncbi:hypothetical protein BH11PSE9_BH11PSE9_04190 [soil metagenome]